MFLLSVLFAYSEDLGIQGAVVSRVKKLVLTSILLVAFPGLTTFIRDLGQEIALSIDNLQGIDEFLKAASQKAGTYSGNVNSLLQLGNDLLLSFFVSISFLVLYFARFLLVAFYHFYWMILLVTGPFLILGNLFESTTNLSKNLFKNLCLVACWPIIWSILSAFLKGLPFADSYNLEGGYTTIIVMNLILAVSLLFSPFMLSQLCEGLIVGAGSGVYSAGRAAVGMMIPKVGSVMAMTGQRVYPMVKPYIPTRQSLFKASSKIAGKNLVFILFALSSFKIYAQSINIRPGLSTVLCFSMAPDYIAIGESKYFQAQRIGKNLLLRSINENSETNLLVFSKGNLFASYKLTSNLILPHNESINCLEKSLPKADLNSHKSKTTNGNAAQLLSVKWDTLKRDYLNLKVRLSNNEAGELIPNWKKIHIQSNGKKIAYTSLRSERKTLVQGGESTFVIEFTRPNLGSSKAVLIIPSNRQDIQITIGAIK